MAQRAQWRYYLASFCRSGGYKITGIPHYQYALVTFIVRYDTVAYKTPVISRKYPYYSLFLTFCLLVCNIAGMLVMTGFKDGYTNFYTPVQNAVDAAHAQINQAIALANLQANQHLDRAFNIAFQAIIAANQAQHKKTEEEQAENSQ